MNITAFGLIVMMLRGVPVNLGSEVTWDEVTSDVDGNPETMDSYEVVITLDGADPNFDALSNLSVLHPVTKAQLGPLLIGLPPGEYQIWVQAVDVSFNRSEFSAPLGITNGDTIPPAAPMGLRLVTEEP